MRFYNQPHQFYCGVDLHARSMYLCILDQAGRIILHQEVPAEPAAFLEAIAPYRDGLVVACECLLCWYWLADLCQAEKIPFVLGGCNRRSAKLRKLGGCSCRAGGDGDAGRVAPWPFESHETFSSTTTVAPPVDSTSAGLPSNANACRCAPCGL